jgi:pimeloyl-ACP methyl ester carboxylesterase
MKHATVAIGLVILLVPLTTWSQDESTSQDAGPDLFARDSLRIESMVCPFKGAIDYEPGEIECGLLQVPENREKPDSRFIELHFVKLNARPDDELWKKADTETTLEGGRREDPIVYLTGGPGARVDYYVKRFKDHTVLQHRDMYILEQRGIGSSGDFCGFFFTRKPEVRNALTFEDHLAAQLTAKQDCAANALAAGVDLTGYNTIENARDVKALRMALGYDSWNVWGISYGTILGQAYLTTDPTGIRAIVLDANVPLDVRSHPWAWRVVNSYDRVLTKLDELCLGQPDCARRYPDLGGRIREATASVRDSPIVVPITDDERFPSGRAAVFTDIVGFLPFMFLYDEENYPALPALIHAWADAVERRDETLFTAVAVAVAGGGLMDSSEGMSQAILCLDGDTESQAIAGRMDAEEFPILGTAFSTVEHWERLAEFCHEFGMAPRDPTEYTMVQTDIPAIIAEGDMDPITPPPLVEPMLPGFANGTYVEFPFTGHGPTRSQDCAGDMLNAFYDDPSAPVDVSCAESIEPPDFLSLYTTSVGPRLIVRAAEDKKRLIVPALWAGFSVLVTVVAFVVLTFAPLARRIDRRQAAPTMGARWAAWIAALLSTLSVGLFAAAVGVTYDLFEALLLFGLVSWARFAAVAGFLAGFAGIATVALTIRGQLRERLPIATLIGFLLTGFAAVGLSILYIAWDLGVF